MKVLVSILVVMGIIISIQLEIAAILALAKLIAYLI